MINKVVCIDTEDCDLIYGKTYIVLETTYIYGKAWYIIDGGIYDKNRFMTLDELRNEKLKRIL